MKATRELVDDFLRRQADDSRRRAEEARALGIMPRTARTAGAIGYDPAGRDFAAMRAAERAHAKQEA